MIKNIKNKFFFIRYFIFIVLIFATTIGIVLISFYLVQKSNYIGLVKNNELHTNYLQIENIENKFANIFSDLLFLAKQNGLSRLIESNNTGFKKIVSYEYLEFCKIKKKYDQIRYIDENGMEICRVNYNNGNPYIEPENSLQNKKLRYYFYDTFNLSEGEVFASPLDLNIEHGKLENPKKPMIRFGTPVFDKKNNKKGIVVLNYFGDLLIKSIKEISNLSIGSIFLLNPQSYFLLSPDSNQEWGFMYKNKSEINFANKFPDLWNLISNNNHTQILTKEGLYTVCKVFPMLKNIKSSSGSPNAFKKSINHFDGSKYHWLLVSFISTKRLYASMESLKNYLFTIWLIIVILSCIPSAMIAFFFVKRKLYKDELAYAANYDKLTDLPNRKLFMDRLSSSIKLCDRYNTNLALFFIDLDGFKKVNDTFGHATGDSLLKEVAKRLSQAIRKSDTVARLGGDEFTAILHNIKNKNEITPIAEKIINSLSSPFFINNTECKISASLGISYYTPELSNHDILLTKADNAMYSAKKSGKNQFCFSN